MDRTNLPAYSKCKNLNEWGENNPILSNLLLSVLLMLSTTTVLYVDSQNLLYGLAIGTILGCAFFTIRSYIQQ